MHLSVTGEFVKLVEAIVTHPVWQRLEPTSSLARRRLKLVIARSGRDEEIFHGMCDSLRKTGPALTVPGSGRAGS